MLANGRVRCEEGIECEQRLDNAGLHVEDAGAENFSAGGAEGHFVERAGTVDGVVMAQDKKLAGRFCRDARAPFDSDVIAADFLSDELDAYVAFAPFGSDQFGAAVSGRFFGAGRFGECEGA